MNWLTALNLFSMVLNCAALALNLHTLRMLLRIQERDRE